MRCDGEQPRFRPLGFSQSGRKGYAVKNVAGALHAEAMKCMLPVGPEVITEIPAQSKISRTRR